jgi:hypothetical protein
MGLSSPNEAWEKLTFGLWSNSLNSAWRFRGNLRVDFLERAAVEVSRRHSILRCGFKYLDGKWQFVSNQARAAAVVMLAVSHAGAEAEAWDLMSEAIWRPFCLEIESPLRVVAVSISQTDHLVGFVVYHAMGDADSLRIVANDLATTYDAFVRAEPAPLGPIPIQYLDYRISVDNWTSGPCARAVLSDWARYLDGAPKLNSSAGPLQTGQFTLSQTDSDKLRALSVTEQVGPHRVWEVIYQITLARLIGQTDVATLSTYNLRHREPQLLETVGPLANTIPNRARFAAIGENTFRRALRSRRDAKFKELAYRVIPLNLMLEHCGLVMADLPTFNYLPGGMVASVHADQGENVEHMLRSLSGRALVAAPPDLTYSKIGRGVVICGAAVYGHDEFAVNCFGTIQRPFTPTELLSEMELITSHVAGNPDCELAVLLTRATAKHGHKIPP